MFKNENIEDYAVLEKELTKNYIEHQSVNENCDDTSGDSART